MNTDMDAYAAGWRELALAVSARLGTLVTTGRVRWAVEASGKDFGRRLGTCIVFGPEDIDAITHLVAAKTSKNGLARARPHHQEAASDGEQARGDRA